MMFKLLGIFVLVTLVVASANKRKSFGSSPDIVNGTDANILEVPFIVSLQYISSNYSYHSCGASLLSSRWLLTASHCIEGSYPEEFLVEYGRTEIADGYNGTQTVLVEKLIIHEKYDLTGQLENDIGLVKLASPIVWDVDFRVRLPLLGQYTPTGTPAVLAGWGRLGVSRHKQNISRELIQRMFSRLDSQSAQFYKKLTCKFIHLLIVQVFTLLGTSYEPISVLE